MQYAARGDVAATSGDERASEPRGGEATRDRNTAQAGAAIRSRGGGQPLAAPVKGKMEHAFGADFGEVRVHEDGAAGALGAKAYAAGTDIHMAPGEYAPDSEQGQELIGHELAHVVQQGQGRVAGGPQAKGGGINQDAGLEREADEMGAKAARGQRVGSFGAIAAKRGGPLQLKTINKVKGGGTVDTADTQAFTAYVKTLSPSELATLEGQLADEPAAKKIVTAAILAGFDDDEPEEKPKKLGGAPKPKAAPKAAPKALNKNTLRGEVVDLKVKDLADPDYRKAAFTLEEDHKYTTYAADCESLLAKASKPIADLKAYDAEIQTKLRSKNAEVKQLVKRYNALENDSNKCRLIRAYGPSSSVHFASDLPAAHARLADTFGKVVEYASRIPLENVVAVSKTLAVSPGFAAFAVTHRIKAFELLLAANGAKVDVAAETNRIEADQRKQRFAQVYGPDADASGSGPAQLEALIGRVVPTVSTQVIAAKVPIPQLEKVNGIVATTVGFSSFLATYKGEALAAAANHPGGRFELSTAREQLQGAVGITNTQEDDVSPGSAAFAQGASAQFAAFDQNNRKDSLTSAQKLAVMGKPNIDALHGAEKAQYALLKPDADLTKKPEAAAQMQAQLQKEKRKLPQKVKGSMELTLANGTALKHDLQIFLSGGPGSSDYSYGPGLARTTGEGTGTLKPDTYNVMGQKAGDYKEHSHIGHHEKERDNDAEVKIMEQTIDLLRKAKLRGEIIEGAVLKIFVSRYTCPSCADMLYKAKTSVDVLKTLGGIEVIYQGEAMD